MLLFLLFIVVAAFSQSAALQRHPGGRIVGGTEASPEQFPYMASLFIETNNAFYLCGGALISNEYILTAAHCLDGARIIAVQIGSNSLKETDENRITLTTNKYVIHPEYNSSTLENDIGVIHLQTYVTFTDYVLPIYLPYKKLDEFKPVITMGWGQLHDGDEDYPDRLQFINATTLSQTICKEIYGQSLIKDSMICVEGVNNRNTCLGDSGGPLVEYHNSVPWQVGIVSFLSNQGCESSYPLGFTRTFPFREWIRNVTNV